MSRRRRAEESTGGIDHAQIAGREIVGAGDELLALATKRESSSTLAGEAAGTREMPPAFSFTVNEFGEVVLALKPCVQTRARETYGVAIAIFGGSSAAGPSQRHRPKSLYFFA
jgi:hypothetical protein